MTKQQAVNIEVGDEVVFEGQRRKVTKVELGSMGAVLFTLEGVSGRVECEDLGIPRVR